MHRSQVGRSHARDAQRLQLGLGQGDRACSSAQDGGVGVHHGLNFGGAVGGAAGQASQCAVDCGQVAAGQPGDARIGVVGGGGCGVAAGVAREHSQRGRGDVALIDSCRRGHHALQFCQCVDPAAVVGGGCNRRLHDRQITGTDARDAECLQIGQCGGCATGSCALYGIDGVGDRLELDQAVGGRAGECSDRVVNCNQVVGVH